MENKNIGKVLQVMGPVVDARFDEGKLPPITEGTGLGDVIRGTKAGRTSDDERICFIASGMPVWDVGWGYELYLNAREMGLGQTLTLWDSPYLC